jgi:hypothetical protein
MTKILKIIIILNFLCDTAFSCTCRFEGYNFEFFKNIKYSFIGTVVKIDNKNFKNTFTFKVSKIYKGKIDTVIQVQSGTGGGDCGAYFELNKTYLVELEWKNKQFETSLCLFNAQKGTQKFSEDTMLLNLFAKKNVYVNLPYTQGLIKNGKQNGYWQENGESGMYLNGKRNGVWKTSYGSEIYYRNNKFLKSIEYVQNEQKTDSFKVIINRRNSERYFPNGKIHKIKKRKALVVYYPTGVIKEKMKLNKHGFIYGIIYKYDEKGNLLEKKHVENDNSEDAYYYFYLD